MPARPSGPAFSVARVQPVLFHLRFGCTFLLVSLPNQVTTNVFLDNLNSVLLVREPGAGAFRVRAIVRISRQTNACFVAPVQSLHLGGSYLIRELFKPQLFPTTIAPESGLER